MKHVLAALALLFLAPGVTFAADCNRFFEGSKPIKESLAAIGAKGWKTITSADKDFIKAFVTKMVKDGNGVPHIEETTLIAVSFPTSPVANVPDEMQPRIVGFASIDGCTIGSGQMPAAMLDAFIAEVVRSWGADT